jgi:flagellar motility protein MotE (MotC chaperone)
MKVRSPLPLVVALLLAGCNSDVRASTQEAEVEETAEAATPAAPTTEDAVPETDADAALGAPEALAIDDSVFALETNDPGQRPPEVKNAERDIMERITQRSRSLDERELSLATRSRSAETLEGELESRLARINALEKRLQDQVGVGEVARQRRDARIESLAELVASMSPQAGSDMVASLSDEDAQWILLAVARKSQRKAAKLMALMPTERAAQLSQLYLDLDPRAVPEREKLSPLEEAAAPDGAASPPSARTDAQRPAPEEVTAP